ncbi:hypothetical protein AVEN_237464-1, partial [Araneus ventricosus]
MLVDREAWTRKREKGDFEGERDPWRVDGSPWRKKKEGECRPTRGAPSINHLTAAPSGFLSLFPTLSYPVLLFGKPVAAKGEKEPSLMRMGSLNSKVKKPSVLSASGRAITRMKSWGSADNIPDRAMNLMPPPKTFPKKKKSRKHADIIG